MNNLIVFDIDGTLIHYIDGEDAAYVDSINSVIRIENINTKWEDYRFSTESGILSEIFYHALKRTPEDAELTNIKDKYVSSLSIHIRDTPDSLECIAGARNVFNLAKKNNWDVAIATGGWSKSAAMKLDTAKIPHHNIPMAHADDHFERKDIIMTAVARAKHFYNKNHYHQITYVGDRLWDLKATQTLGIDFIGVGKHLGSLKNRNFFHIDDYETKGFISYLKNGAAHCNVLDNMNYIT